MGKISPFDVVADTFTVTYRWVHLFLPIALAVAFLGCVLNAYLMGLMPTPAQGEVAALPENFWMIYAFTMAGLLSIQVIQLSLFEAVMERRPAWFSFGWMRALRRLIPVLVGFVLFMLAYLVGFILLVIPGIMVLFLLYMMFPLMLLDDVDPFAAVKKSWTLTWGNAWRLFGAMLLTFLPISIVIWGIAFASGVVSLDSVQQPPMALSDWRTWVWILLTGGAGMFAAAFYLVAFKALKSAASGEGETVPDVVAV